MWYVYIRDNNGLTLFDQGEWTRKEMVDRRRAAGSVAKAKGLTGSAVVAFGPCDRVKVGIHGYK